MRTIMRASTALAGFVAVLHGGLAMAEEVVSAGFEEIIVTAQKRATSLQETPLSIIAFDGSALESAGAESTLDLQRMVPGLAVSTNTAAAQIFIRGVGTNFGGDQSVAVHVDGVYQVTTQAALQDFLDVERIEVLRGPQGTLYGRNATAGVVNIISKRPDMEWGFVGDLQYGNFNKFRQRGTINAPIVADRVAARVSFVNSDRDGFRRNPFLGSRLDDENHYGLRGQVLVKATDDLEFVFSGNYSKEDSSRTLGFKINKNVFAPQVDLLPLFGQPGGTVPDDPDVIFSDKNSIQNNKQYGGSIDMKWDLGAVLVKSLTAYQKTRNAEDIDIDGTEVAYFNGFVTDSGAKWFSQELQIASNTDGPLEWIAGLYYLKDKRQTRGTFTTPIFDELGLSDGPIYRSFDQESRAYAAFGQASYSLNDKLRLTAGARYSEEKKEATQYVNANVDEGVEAIGKAKWTAFTPKFGIDYFLSSDVMIYASATRGFKTGGFNESASNQFDPEYIWSYEAGVRSSWLDDRLRLNMTAFYYDYSDIQVLQALAAPDPSTGATTKVGNAASAKVKGLEFELSVLPVEGLMIAANSSVIDATYKNFLSPNTEVDGNPIVDLSGNRLPRAPKFSASIMARYSHAVGDWGTAFIQGDVYYQSRVFFSAFNQVNDIYDQEKAYALYNAQIGFESADGMWSVSAFGRNLSNKVYRQNIIRALGFFGQLDLLAPPRTYGVELGVKF